jgi:hypothetical protein
MPSGPDHPAWEKYDCNTVVFATGEIDNGYTCLIAQVAAVTAERDEAVKWNHAVSVCAEHTSDIVDGSCVICERAALLARAEAAEALAEAAASQLRVAVDAFEKAEADLERTREERNHWSREAYKNAEMVKPLEDTLEKAREAWRVNTSGMSTSEEWAASEEELHAILAPAPSGEKGER